MKKFMTALMVFSLVLAGVSLAAAADVPQPQKGVTLPQALQGLDLNKAQQITDTQAQTVRGAAQGPQANINPWAGDGVQDTFHFSDPGPHKLDRIPYPY